MKYAPLNATNAGSVLPLHSREEYQAYIEHLRQLHSHHQDFTMHPYIAVPATLALVYRAYSRNSLTPLGIIVAALTAVVHAMHPWSLPFALLVVFFLTGTAVTKVKHTTKSHLTLSSTGHPPSSPSPRTHIQVLANSATASLLTLLHTRALSLHHQSNPTCFPHHPSTTSDLLLIGIIANYAAVAADTFSSELGILSSSKPRLLTSWNLREVPPGTNGGVSLVGTIAGFGGAAVIAVTAAVLVPFCQGGAGWGLWERGVFVVAVTMWGGLGSLVDSALGGWFQESVIDTRTGKVVEGVGGGRVRVREVRVVQGERRGGDDGEEKKAGRRVESGLGVLDNNAVNAVMAAGMSVGGMVVGAWWWGVSLRGVLDGL